MSINIRLKTALEGVKKATERLEDVLLDLSTRDSDPAYQKAKALFDKGARMAHDEDCVNRYEEIVMWYWPRTGRSSTVHLAGGVNRNSKGQWKLVGATSSEECDNVIRHLLNLTEEEVREAK